VNIEPVEIDGAGARRKRARTGRSPGRKSEGGERKANGWPALGCLKKKKKKVLAKKETPGERRNNHREVQVSKSTARMAIEPPLDHHKVVKGLWAIAYTKKYYGRGRDTTIKTRAHGGPFQPLPPDQNYNKEKHGDLF